MSIAFTRTLRSLRADTGRPSLAGMAVGGALLVAWAAWFVLAPITVRESTGDFRLAADGSVLAQFSPEALQRIQPGQAARLKVQGASGEPDRTIPAVVSETPNPNQYWQEWGMVKLTLLTGQGPGEGAAGLVEVDVQTLSPAALLLRSAERLGNLTIPGD